MCAHATVVRIRTFAPDTAMWTLLILFVVHYLEARDASTNSEVDHMVEHIDQCPEVGYYFKRNLSKSLNTINPGICYLCFCQENQTSVCWKRDDRRCNVARFKYHRVGKRNARVRRSFSLSNLIFGDSSKNSADTSSASTAAKTEEKKTECIPHEDSYSKDCPPADWCTGCTVCDCNDSGHYDCHLLSFCVEGQQPKSGPKKHNPKKTKSNAEVKKPTNKVNPKRTIAKPVKNNFKHSNNTKTTTKTQKKVVKFQKSIPTSRKQKQKWLRTKFSKKATKKPNVLKKTAPKKHKETPLKTIKSNKVLLKNGNNFTFVDAKNYTTEITKQVLSTLLSEMDTIINNRLKAYQEQMKNTNLVISKHEEDKIRLKRQPTTPNPAVKEKKILKKSPEHIIDHSTNKPVVKRSVSKAIDKTSENDNKLEIEKPQDEGVAHWVPRYKRDVTTTAINHKENMNKSENMGVSTTSPVINNLELHNTFHTTTNSILDKTYYRYNVIREAYNSPPLAEVEDIIIKEQDSSTRNINHKIPESNKKTFFLNKIRENDILIPNNGPFYDNYLQANEFSQKHYLKLLKPKKVIIDIQKNGRKHLNTNKLKNFNKNGTKLKIFGKDVDRILNTKKYNLVRVLGTNTHNAFDYKDGVENSLASNKSININDLLLKLFDAYTKNSNKIVAHRRAKRLAAKYLKKLFRHFLHRTSNKRYIRNYEMYVDKLCESIPNCKIGVIEKQALKSKLMELEKETTIVVSSVTIIKELLEQIDFPTNKYSDKIQQLNAILRNSFYNKETLTSAEIIQITKIKSYTQDFITSVGRFACILYDIMAILNNSTIPREEPRKRMTENMNNNEYTRNDFKPLLEKYNIIHNKFMKKMYRLLNDFKHKESKQKKSVEHNIDTNHIVPIEKPPIDIIGNLRKLKPIAEIFTNKTRRKRQVRGTDNNLEYLLMMMEFFLKHNRPLEEVPASDGIDLLIDAIKTAPDIKTTKKKVLEISHIPPIHIVSTTTNKYILKSYEPSPKNIKLVSEKENYNVNPDENVEEPVLETKLVKRTKGLVDIYEEEKGFGENETGDKGTDETLSKDAEDKSVSIVDEKSLQEIEKKMLQNETSDSEPIEEYAPKITYVNEKPPYIIEDESVTVYYNKIEDDAADNDPTSSSAPTTGYYTRKGDSDDSYTETSKINKEDKTTTVNTYLKGYRKLVNSKHKTNKTSRGGTDFKRQQTISVDLDEEYSAPSIVYKHGNNVEADNDTPPSDKISRKGKNLKFQYSEEKNASAKQLELEWIEENFGKHNRPEIKELRDLIKNSSRRTSTKKQSLKNINKENVSATSRETIDAYEKKLTKDKYEESVMFKKQMDLLNSLDYGTERGDFFDDSDSKDGNNDARYDSETDFA